MSLFDSLKPLDVEKHYLTVSVSKYGLMFTKPILEARDMPRYVEVSVDADRKLFGLRPAKEPTKYTRDFVKDGVRNNTMYVKWNSRDIISFFSECLGREVSELENTIKVAGEFDPSDSSIVFDLNKVG